MMRYICPILIIVLCFYSCKNDRKTEFLINNDTGSVIDTFKITYGTEKEYRKFILYNINSGDMARTVLDMNLKGIDGGYFLEVFQNEKKIQQQFGYYGNAVFENYVFNLTIERDTVLINRNPAN